MDCATIANRIESNRRETKRRRESKENRIGDVLIDLPIPIISEDLEECPMKEEKQQSRKTRDRIKVVERV